MIERQKPTSREMAQRVRHAQLSALLKDQRFRDWSLWFFSQAGILNQSASADLHATFFAEGRRSLGNLVLAEFCAADPSAAQLLFPDSSTLLRVGLGQAARAMTPGDADDRYASPDTDS